MCSISSKRIDLGIGHGRKNVPELLSSNPASTESHKAEIGSHWLISMVTVPQEVNQRVPGSS